MIASLTDPNAIREILTADGVTYETVRDILNAYFPNLPIYQRLFKNEPHEFKQGTSLINWIYRARLVKPHQSRWSKVSDIDAIPKGKLHLIREHGRVNKRHQSIFYGSLNPHTACVETYAKGENMELILSGKPAMAVVGAWKAIAPIDFCQIPLPVDYTRSFMVNDMIKALNLRFQMDKIEKQAEHVRGMINDEKAYNDLTFFSEAFARLEIDNHRQYMISNYYADRVLGLIAGYEPTAPVEGIMYYSAPSSFQELNVAMQPEMAARKLQFSHAYTMIIWHDPINGQNTWFPYEQGIRAVDGVIQWRKPSPTLHRGTVLPPAVGRPEARDEGA
ncbi:MAG: RES domain-containing protein [Flavobacteriales bacterium]|nr:RES domain-containing protein [Flavobacteriales bacterium]